MDDNYLAAPDRYQRQPYRPVGRHGLRLPSIGLGLWHIFGNGSDPARVKAMVHQAFDLGITHFDLANNYGPPPGSAETCFGGGADSSWLVGATRGGSASASSFAKEERISSSSRFSRARSAATVSRSR